MTDLIETPSPFMTAEEVGQLIRLSAKTVYRVAATDPTFPSVKVGGTLRFPRARVLRWLEQRTKGSATPRASRP